MAEGKYFENGKLTVKKSTLKGFLADALSADVNDRLVFQYTPTTLSEKKDTGWAEMKVPGADDTLAQFGSGSSLEINIQLFFNQLGENPPLGSVYRNSTYNYVEACLSFLHRYTERQRKASGAGLSPGLLLFGFGNSVFGTGSSYGVALGFPAMLVRITDLKVNRSFFDPSNMRTRRATADLSLVRHVFYPR